MDRSDALVLAGLVLIAAAVYFIHPALVLALIGYAAFTHGLSRSR